MNAKLGFETLERREMMDAKVLIDRAATVDLSHTNDTGSTHANQIIFDVSSARIPNGAKVTFDHAKTVNFDSTIFENYDWLRTVEHLYKTIRNWGDWGDISQWQTDPKPGPNGYLSTVVVTAPTRLANVVRDLEDLSRNAPTKRERRDAADLHDRALNRLTYQLDIMYELPVVHQPAPTPKPQLPPTPPTQQSNSNGHDAVFDAIGQAAGSFIGSHVGDAGAVEGSQLGAAAGSVAGPAGSVVGSVVGAEVGRQVGKAVGNAVGKAFHHAF